MAELFSCQCARATESCIRPPTQEGDLCDGCRAGCSVFRVGGPADATAEQMAAFPVYDHHAWIERTASGIRFRASRPPGTWPPQIDSALPGVQGPADARTSPHSARTSPHAGNAGPTRHPRNEEQ